MTPPNRLASLNAQQRAAVCAPPGPVLVQAGAGTGKTHVLTLRIAHLIEHYHVAPTSILAVTFTNKAANELRERLKHLLGSRSRSITSGTFHALCAKLLRTNIFGRISPYTADFTIYAHDEQQSLAAEILETASERAPQAMDPQDLLRRISRAKSRLLSPRVMLRLARNSPIDHFVAGCYLRYQRTLEQANALDFDDLIMLAHRLLLDHPEVLQECQRRWCHILVDEYQDTDPSQHALLELLSRPYAPDGVRSLFAVGDGMQAIYGFRNADYTIISRFNEDFPNAQVIQLTTNYRSRQTILDAAYAVIRQSRSMPAMALQSEGKRTRESQCLAFLDSREPREEAEKIAACIDDLLRGGRSANEIAILYRTRHMSRPLETALRRARIPYLVRGSTGFYDRAVVRDALAYLRIIVNPNDSLSLNRILNVPPRGLGARSVTLLTTYAAQHGISLLEALAHPLALQPLGQKAHQGAQLFHSLVRRWQHLAKQGYPPNHLITDVLQQSGYLASLEHRCSAEELPDAEAHLQELILAAQEHTSLSEFLQEIALVTNLDREKDEHAAVELLTIHAAKGLEWPCVLVVGLEEGTLPHEHNLQYVEGIEEERRLCYVALTRAGERLFLSRVDRRGRPLPPSRFLQDIEAYGREQKHRSYAAH